MLTPTGSSHFVAPVCLVWVPTSNRGRWSHRWGQRKRRSVAGSPAVCRSLWRSLRPSSARDAQVMREEPVCSMEFLVPSSVGRRGGPNWAELGFHIHSGWDETNHSDMELLGRCENLLLRPCDGDLCCRCSDRAPPPHKNRRNVSPGVAFFPYKLGKSLIYATLAWRPSLVLRRLRRSCRHRRWQQDTGLCSEMNETFRQDGQILTNTIGYLYL